MKPKNPKPKTRTRRDQPRVVKPKLRVKTGAPELKLTPLVIAMLDQTPNPKTVTQMCETLNISRDKFYRWGKESEAFAEAVLRVRATADDAVENAFYNRALGYDRTMNEDRLDKDGGVVSLSKDIHVPADTRAGEFWLRNRDPSKWQNKQVIEIAGDHVERVEKAIAALGLTGKLDDA